MEAKRYFVECYAASEENEFCQVLYIKATSCQEAIQFATDILLTDKFNLRVWVEEMSLNTACKVLDRLPLKRK